jgi:hypothetical protein
MRWRRGSQVTRARPAELPGIALAALASIGLGVVIGPEAPLIALGDGLAFLVVWLGKRRDVRVKTVTVVVATGSFAAISTLLGSPLAGRVGDRIGLGVLRADIPTHPPDAQPGAGETPPHAQVR